MTPAKWLRSFRVWYTEKKTKLSDKRDRPKQPSRRRSQHAAFMCSCRAAGTHWKNQRRVNTAKAVILSVTKWSQESQSYQFCLRSFHSGLFSLTNRIIFFLNQPLTAFSLARPEPNSLERNPANPFHRSGGLLYRWHDTISTSRLTTEFPHNHVQNRQIQRSPPRFAKVP